MVSVRLCGVLHGWYMLPGLAWSDWLHMESRPRMAVVGHRRREGRCTARWDSCVAESSIHRLTSGLARAPAVLHISPYWFVS